MFPYFCVFLQHQDNDVNEMTETLLVQTLREQLAAVSAERDRLVEENNGLKLKVREIEGERKTLMEINLEWQRKELKRKALFSKEDESTLEVG